MREKSERKSWRAEIAAAWASTLAEIAAMFSYGIVAVNCMLTGPSGARVSVNDAVHEHFAFLYRSGQLPRSLARSAHSHRLSCPRVGLRHLRPLWVTQLSNQEVLLLPDFCPSERRCASNATVLWVTIKLIC